MGFRGNWETWRGINKKGGFLERERGKRERKWGIVVFKGGKWGMRQRHTGGITDKQRSKK